MGKEVWAIALESDLLLSGLEAGCVVSCIEATAERTRPTLHLQYVELVTGVVKTRTSSKSVPGQAANSHTVWS